MLKLNVSENGRILEHRRLTIVLTVPIFNPDNRNISSSASSESSQSPVVEAGGSHGHMSPEEHYRRMMSALSEQGTYEEQQQRLYQLASSMGLPGHG